MPSITKACPTCGKLIYSANLARHLKIQHAPEPTPDVFKCKVCQLDFDSLEKIDNHTKNVHGKRHGNRLQASEVNLDAYNEEFHAVLKPVKQLIATSITEQPHQIIFNYQLTEPTYDLLDLFFDDVFERLSHAAKINVHFGCILRNRETGALRYHYADKNEAVFSASVFVRDHATLGMLKDRLEGEDYFERATSERPDTKWVFAQMTNVSIRATLVRDLAMGCKTLELPRWLTTNNSIITHVISRVTKHPYKDNLCFFRGLACHTKGDSTLEVESRALFNQFLQHPGIEAKGFRGVKLSDFGDLEQLFRINIIVYTAEYKDGKIQAEVIHRSRKAFEDTIFFSSVQQASLLPATSPKSTARICLF